MATHIVKIGAVLRTLAVTTLLAAAAVGTAAQAQTAGGPPKDRIFLTINSGPQGSGWYVVSGLIAEQIEKTFPNARVTNTPGQPVANTRAVDAKRADMGTEFGWLALTAMEGTKPYKKPVHNVAAISGLYPTHFQLFARADSGIKSYADLANKRIAVGTAGTSGDRMTQRILAFYGLNYDKIRQNGGSVSFSAYNDAKQLMSDGHLDAFTISSTKPNTQAVELQLTQDIRLIPLEEKIVDQYVKKFRGFGKSQIAAGTYKNQPQAVWAISVPALITVRKDLPENVVYWITKAWWDHASQIGKAYSMVKDDMVANVALKDLVVPLHPGSARYFKEIGVLK
ncbi:MAG: hypothetical protein A3H32_16635 [Betaproteobacteria bacterium RIFCSPLOWO2_02_FULL_63_19]|nr:MAG: hypothetical protein A3H32_16635 [Betaproteobacteria bacterium RIFCSPLOWO2_02_FULL_63_19]